MQTYNFKYIVPDGFFNAKGGIMGKVISAAIGLIGGYIFYQHVMPLGLPPGSYHFDAIDNYARGVAVVALVIGLVLIFKSSVAVVNNCGVALVFGAFASLGLTYYTPPADAKPTTPAAAISIQR